MTMLFPAMLLVIMIAVGGVLFRSGLWSNTLLWINAILAGLIATNYFEPLASWLQGMIPALAYLWDFFSLWLLFVASFFLLRMITDHLSHYRVRFHFLVDLIGGGAMALLFAWVVVCFTTFTIHTAPLARTAFLGGFDPQSKVFFGVVAPDRLWLAFVHQVSGANASGGRLGRGGTEADPELHVFDPEGDFMLRYATRRDKFSEAGGFLVRKPQPVR